MCWWTRCSNSAVSRTDLSLSPNPSVRRLMEVAVATGCWKGVAFLKRCQGFFLLLPVHAVCHPFLSYGGMCLESFLLFPFVFVFFFWFLVSWFFGFLSFVIFCVIFFWFLLRHQSRPIKSATDSVVPSARVPLLHTRAATHIKERGARERDPLFSSSSPSTRIEPLHVGRASTSVDSTCETIKKLIRLVDSIAHVS